MLLFGCRSLHVEGGVGGQLHSFCREEACGLMVAMSAVHSTPPIDDDVRAEAANDADHVFENLVAPDFFGFLGSFRIPKVFRAREIESYAVPACGGEKLLRSNQS